VILNNLAKSPTTWGVARR